MARGNYMILCWDHKAPNNSHRCSQMGSLNLVKISRRKAEEVNEVTKECRGNHLETWLLTEKQARELHANMGRKLDFLDTLKKEGKA